MPGAKVPHQVFSRQLGLTVEIRRDGGIELSIGNGTDLGLPTEDVIGTYMQPWLDSALENDGL